MAHIIIQPEHLPALGRLQHVLEWLQAERARLESELTHVVHAGEREEAKLVALLQQTYGLDARRMPVTVDVERGVLITPDEPEPPSSPAGVPSDPSPSAPADSATAKLEPEPVPTEVQSE